MIPYNRKLERNKFELILVFWKWFLLDFSRAVALFDLCEFLWILFNARTNAHAVGNLFLKILIYNMPMYNFIFVFVIQFSFLFLIKKLYVPPKFYPSPTCTVHPCRPMLFFFYVCRKKIFFSFSYFFLLFFF